MHHHGNDSKRCTQTESSDIPHEHHCRIGVEPQETEAGSYQGGTENQHLSGPGNVGDSQILGELVMAGHVGKDPERTRNHYGWHHGKAVETVCEVDGVAGSDDDKVGKQDKPRTHVYGHMLEERNYQFDLHRRAGREIQEKRGPESGHRLPEIFGPGADPAGIFAHELLVVVSPSYCTECKGREQNHPDEPIGQIGPEQRGYENSHQDERASHGRGSGLGQVGLGTVAPHGLADLVLAELADHERAHDKADSERSEHTENSAQREIAKDIKKGNVVRKFLEKVKKH